MEGQGWRSSVWIIDTFETPKHLDKTSGSEGRHDCENVGWSQVVFDLACGEHPSLRRPRRKPSGAPPRKLGRRGGASKGWWSRGRGRRKPEEYGDMETNRRKHLKERAVSCANLCWKFKQHEDWKMFIRLSLLEIADHLSRSWLGLWLGEQC